MHVFEKYKARPFRYIIPVSFQNIKGCSTRIINRHFRKIVLSQNYIANETPDHLIFFSTESFNDFPEYRYANSKNYQYNHISSNILENRISNKSPIRNGSF